MTRGAPKGQLLAVTAIKRVGFSRLQLYEFYDGDDPLLKELSQFHGRWWSSFGRSLRRLDDCLPDLADAQARLAALVGAGPARDYLGELGDLATEAGLDRIPMVGTPPVVIVGYLPSGTGQAHRFLWQLDKAILWEAAPAETKASRPPVGRPTFVKLAEFGAAIPAVNTSIGASDARWDPRTETLAHARRRLRDETGWGRDAIEAELARIADEGGYQFPDTSTVRGGISRLDRDAEWVWWRIRHRWTYERIVREWDRRHPGDVRLQYRLEDDEVRKWKADHPEEAGILWAPAEAVGLVRKAVTTFAGRARVDVRTGPGRRAGSSSVIPRQD